MSQKSGNHSFQNSENSHDIRENNDVSVHNIASESSEQMDVRIQKITNKIEHLVTKYHVSQLNNIGRINRSLKYRMKQRI